MLRNKVKSLMKFSFYLKFIPIIVTRSVIETEIGIIKGTTLLSRNGHRFNAFLGVPYAKPPVNGLRFQNPEPVDPWQGILDATKYAPRCPQAPGTKGYEGEEDCLYLNIYTPSETFENLPIWVFIYGGRRISGHVAPYKHGPHYIMDKDVIFITMSYRIGPLGFLSTEDNVISGNYGLKDEVMAIKWIKQNIQSFGGDPTNITITGGSTGAMDVSLLLISQTTKGLFQRAISQSGHPLSTVMLPGTARTNAWMLGNLVNCSSDTIKISEHLLKCLQNVPAEELIMSWTNYRKKSLISFGPVIESSDASYCIICQHPFTELKRTHNIPWMLGFNIDEGSVGALGFSDMFSQPNIHELLRKLLPNSLHYSNHLRKNKITDRILSTYLNSTQPDELFQGYSKVFSLAHFIAGALDTARIYKGPLYFYVYSHKNTPSYIRNYSLRGLLCKYETGVTHGEELRSLQHYPLLLPPILTGEDRLVSEKVVSMWYNFVKTGNPNDNEENTWNPVVSEKIEYLLIGINLFKMNTNPFYEDYKFWKTLLL